MNYLTKSSLRPVSFQPFFTPIPTDQGTGLSLSLAYDMVTKGHVGSIQGNSIEGVGLPTDQANSEFIISLPFKSNR